VASAVSNLNERSPRDPDSIYDFPCWSIWIKDHQLIINLVLGNCNIVLIFINTSDVKTSILALLIQFVIFGIHGDECPRRRSLAALAFGMSDKPLQRNVDIVLFLTGNAVATDLSVLYARQIHAFD
jgi:hypothetical protein